MIKYTSIHQVFIKIYIKIYVNVLVFYILFFKIPNFLNEKGIEEIVNNKDFEKSDIDIETYESIEELKFPQEYENTDGGIIILDDLNEKEMTDPRVQAMFRQSRHNNPSIFIISQDYYELPKKTIRANGNMYHIFKPNIFRDVQNLYQDMTHGFDP